MSHHGDTLSGNSVFTVSVSCLVSVVRTQGFRVEHVWETVKKAKRKSHKALRVNQGVVPLTNLGSNHG